MSEAPRFSVIIVTLNAEHTISVALNSVLNQTLEDIEVIIVDGASTDRTLELIRHFNDPRVKIISEKDDGIYFAMNKGINFSRGEFIHFLNADDFFANDDVLLPVYNLFVETEACVIYSDIAFVDGTGKILARWRSSPFKRGEISNGFHVPHPGFFAKAALYDRLGGFDESMSIAADFDLMARFLEDDYTKVKYFQKTTVHMNPHGYSSRLSSIIIGFFEIRRTLKKLGAQTTSLRFILNRYRNKLFRKLMVLFKGSV